MHVRTFTFLRVRAVLQVLHGAGHFISSGSAQRHNVLVRGNYNPKYALSTH